MTLHRRLFLVAWLSLLLYLLYAALVKSGMTPPATETLERVAPLASFIAPTSAGVGDGGVGGDDALGGPSTMPSFPGMLLSGGRAKALGVAEQTAPIQAPKAPVIFGASGGSFGSAGGGYAPAAAAAAAVAAAPLLPVRCVDRNNGAFPYTSVRRYAPGQVCLKNAYVVQGKLRAHVPPKGAPGHEEVLAYLTEEGFPSASFEALTGEHLEFMERAPIPSVPFAGALLESQLEGVAWGTRDHLLAFSYIFIEASANILALQALEAAADGGGGGGAAPPKLHPAPLLCCGCGPHMGGVGHINFDVAKGVWGAELTQCAEVVGEPPGPRPPALIPGCTSAGGLLHRGSADGRKPWTLHAETLCLTDRTPAFARDGRVQKWKSFSASLQRLLGPGERGFMEGNLARLRAYALSALKERGGELAGLRDEFNTVIMDAVVDGSPEAGPLITVLARQDTEARNFPHVALASLHALFRPLTKRLLVIKALPLPGWLRLAIASRTDLLVGTHGEDMGLLLFQPKGAAVLELAPHYNHYDVEGTGWSNALGFLSRLKGGVYGGADGPRGPINPVGRATEDLDYAMELPVYINNSALLPEVLRLLKEARKNAEPGAFKEGEWPAWHPLFVSEDESFPGVGVGGEGV
jgi:hypothetical protein